MTVKTVVDGDITIRKVIGEYTVDRMLAYLRLEYKRGATHYWVWDLSEAFVRGLKVNDFNRTVDCVARYGHSQAGGKSAIIAPHRLTFGLSRLFNAYARLVDLPIETATFRTKEEAEGWLGVKIPPID